MSEIRIFCYHEEKVEQIYCFSISNKQHSQLEKLINDNFDTDGRRMLNCLMRKVNNESLHKCVFCNVCDATRSFHRTRIRKWKDGRLCIENHPIFICRHDFCAEKANLTESALTNLYGERVISDAFTNMHKRKEQEKELRICVSCKELLHMSSFSRSAWIQYDRRCNRCLSSIRRCKLGKAVHENLLLDYEGEIIDTENRLMETLIHRIHNESRPPTLENLSKLLQIKDQI